MSNESGPPSYEHADIFPEDASDLPTYEIGDLPRFRALTTHEYSMKPKPNTNITLTLLDSHSPAPDKVPLFYVPSSITGVIKIELAKTSAIRGISVYLQGRKVPKGTRNMELNPGAPGALGVFFTKSTNLPLADVASPPGSPTSESKGKGTAYSLTGTHEWPFSLEIPETYTKEKSSGAGAWTKGLFGSKKEKEPESGENEKLERPLPPTTLQSQMHLNDPNLYQYAIFVSVETGSMHDNYRRVVDLYTSYILDMLTMLARADRFSKQVVLLPAAARPTPSDVKVAPSTGPSSSGRDRSGGGFVPV